MNHPCGDGMNTTQVKADKGDGLYNWLYNMTGVHHPREGMKSWNLSTKSMIQCLTFSWAHHLTGIPAPGYQLGFAQQHHIQ